MTTAPGEDRGPGRPEVVVLGVGNPMRRDDGVGPAAVEALARRGVGPGVELRAIGGEPARLVEAWADRRLAVVVDAVRSGRSPGTVHRLDADRDRLPGRTGATSAHGAGVGEALALAGALGRRPRRLVVLGIEAGELGHGSGLSPPVAAALDQLVDRVVEEIRLGPGV
jgi:hydrogenase maturation protease